MSPSRAIPLRAVFRLWRELALPDDFEDSVLAANPALFSLRANPKEPNTHILSLLGPDPRPNLVPAVDAWRARERAREGNKADEMELKFGFRQAFPPGMKLRKDFRAKLREWQRLPYDGPYDEPRRGGRRAAEKRAVAVMHELLSWTAEGMVEVEKVSHLRRWFGMELNIRDLFLDHPGVFYLSTKGKRHTVFLREMYDRGGLAEPNPVYEARRGLLELVLMRRRGMVHGGVSPSEPPWDDDEESDDNEDACVSDYEG